MLPIAAARAAAPPIDWSSYHPPRPRMLLQQAMDVCTGPSCDHRHHVGDPVREDLHRLPARGAARLHRLAAVLQRLGDARPVPRHPAQPDHAARPPAGCTRTRRRCSTRSSTEKWLRANGVFGLFPANQVDGDDIEVYTDESRTRRPDDPAPAPAADRGPGRLAAQVAGRLRRAEGDRAARLRRRLRGDRRPRARPSGSRSSRRPTTTTARSCWSRWPTGSPRRSPSGCTSGCARSSGPTRPTSTSTTTR